MNTASSTKENEFSRGRIIQADLLNMPSSPMIQHTPDHRIGLIPHATAAWKSAEDYRKELRESGDYRGVPYFNLDEKYDEINNGIKESLKDKPWYSRFMDKRNKKKADQEQVADPEKTEDGTIVVSEDGVVKVSLGNQIMTFSKPKITTFRVSTMDEYHLMMNQIEAEKRENAGSPAQETTLENNEKSVEDDSPPRPRLECFVGADGPKSPEAPFQGNQKNVEDGTPQLECFVGADEPRSPKTSLPNNEKIVDEEISPQSELCFEADSGEDSIFLFADGSADDLLPPF